MFPVTENWYPDSTQNLPCYQLITDFEIWPLDINSHWHHCSPACLFRTLGEKNLLTLQPFSLFTYKMGIQYIDIYRILGAEPGTQWALSNLDSRLISNSNHWGFCRCVLLAFVPWNTPTNGSENKINKTGKCYLLLFSPKESQNILAIGKFRCILEQRGIFNFI